ncbi:MAG: ABC transporter permease [Actinobacteria bacterium]|nr:ABC transporter permease [Actinomycetota bacterium]MBO0832258.1 ABC transporter permease [Actinomycetota bacterium]MBO0836042.1 ABC transporter permease [Actinomycetota bacterium]
MQWSSIPQYTLFNAYLGLVPPLIGLIISIPLGVLCVARPWLYPPVLSLTSALYAIPTLAIFVVLIDYTGLGFLTVIIALTLFSLCVLLPNVVDGLRSVDEPVRQAATAMGFTQVRRLVQVELPLAVPVIIAGLRVAVVSSISLASLGGLIGVSSYGYYFIDGLQRDLATEIYVGLALTLLLALACDLLLVGVRWLLTPWARGRRTLPSEFTRLGTPQMAGVQ